VSDESARVCVCVRERERGDAPLLPADAASSRKGGAIACTSQCVSE